MVKRYFNKSGLPLVSRDDGAWVKYTDYAALAERCERLEAALRRIATMNAAYDSDYGFNEWGEADCFNQVRVLAAEALSENNEGNQ